MKVFTSLSLERTVVEKFRKFSRDYDNSYSATLSQMMDFFRDNKLSPADALAGDLQSRDQELNKRLNTIIAILRDIEKTQTQPALAILQSLISPIATDAGYSFQPPPKKELSPTVTEEKKESPKEISSGSEKHELLKDLKYLVDHVKPQKNWMGQEQLILDLPREELERFKIKFKNY